MANLINVTIIEGAEPTELKVVEGAATVGSVANGRAVTLRRGNRTYATVSKSELLQEGDVLCLGNPLKDGGC